LLRSCRKQRSANSKPHASTPTEHSNKENKIANIPWSHEQQRIAATIAHGEALCPLNRDQIYGVVDVVVVVVVVVGAPPPPLLLFDNARTPKAITTPAPTSHSKGGSLSVWACFTPAAAPGDKGPVSADIAGNGAMTSAALAITEISAFLTLSSPILGIFVSSLYHS
jgi:hypothetical protein